MPPLPSCLSMKYFSSSVCPIKLDNFIHPSPKPFLKSAAKRRFKKSLLTKVTRDARI
jgi:hypothetical protein